MMDAIFEWCFEILGEIYHSVFMFDTELTESQKRAKAVVEKLYAILGNLAFLIILAIFCTWLIVESGMSVFLAFAIQHRPQVLLILVPLSLLLIYALLKLFQFVRSAELMKLYVFVEIIHLSLDVLSGDKSPTPWVIEALSKLLH
jgi:hypothetical protein